MDIAHELQKLFKLRDMTEVIKVDRENELEALIKQGDNNNNNNNPDSSVIYMYNVNTMYLIN